MSEQGVQGFPTVKMYLEEWIPYNQQRTASLIVDFALQHLNNIAKKRLGSDSKSKGGSSKGGSSKGGSSKGESVIELTDRNFEEKVMKDENGVWFVEFYAPWCGHCKNLAPIWEDLAFKLKGKVNVGKVDATTETILQKRFHIQGYPTLILFPSGIKKDSSAIPYEGPRSISDLTKFAMDFAQENLKAIQMVNETMFEEECSSGLCVMSFLPHIADSSSDRRNKYLNDLNAAVKSSTGMPIKFFWHQGGDQFDVEDKLHLAFGYPAVVAINLEKKKIFSSSWRL